MTTIGIVAGVWRHAISTASSAPCWQLPHRLRDLTRGFA
jgi:hypothetical protein